MEKIISIREIDAVEDVAFYSDERPQTAPFTVFKQKPRYRHTERFSGTYNGLPILRALARKVDS